jgi:cob(I)alamin adenosyltransferase
MIPKNELFNLMRELNEFQNRSNLTQSDLDRVDAIIKELTYRSKPRTKFRQPASNWTQLVKHKKHV